jgi:type IV pilus assembly protein PilB
MCNDTGYYGRIGVYEIMPISNKIRTIISSKGSTEGIQRMAAEEGVNTLRDSMTRHVLAGITSIDEMNKIVYTNVEDEQ